MRGALIAILIALILVVARPAHAHEVGLSRGEYTAAGAVMKVELTFARRELSALVAGLDHNKDGDLSAAEIDREREGIEASVARRVVVTSNGSKCKATLDAVDLTEQDGVVVRASHACAAPLGEVSVSLTFLPDLPFGHRHLAHASAGSASIDAVLSQRSTTFQLTVSGVQAETPKPPPRKFSLLLMGVEHILTGYDHLLFLFGLVLVGGRLRSLLWVVTAFTLAHSITLGLAALGVWAPSPRIIEPAIALSIAYVGVENFFVKDAEKRWRITFPFGLIHGFGFAGALQEVALPKADVPWALFLFNLGVELGQLAVLAPVLPLLLWLRKREGFRTKGVKALSALIIAAGLVWFIARVRG